MINRDKADKYSLYRNVFYGAGAVSILVTGYYLYEYLTFDSSSVTRVHFSHLQLCLSAGILPVTM